MQKTGSCNKGPTQIFYQPYYQRHQLYYAEETTIEKDVPKHRAFFQTNPNRQQRKILKN